LNVNVVERKQRKSEGTWCQVAPKEAKPPGYAKAYGTCTVVVFSSSSIALTNRLLEKPQRKHNSALE
jgi:hypothetical protein